MASEIAAAPVAPSDSASQIADEPAQTAQDYIASQLTLEADAREALPYQFDTCTKPLGPLRQSVYACLTCTPPPASPHQQFTPAGVCYSCSISCHGEHTLVELFTKRNFVCDCGTTRFATSGTTCTLRTNATTGAKNVTGEEARVGNKYNQNFQGRFCGCGDDYDPEKEKGTMYQCIGLGTVETGGCGEDWWHPECLMGLPRTKPVEKPEQPASGSLETVKEEGENGDTVQANADEEEDTPPGFPDEDDFEHLICHKCVDAFPWIKRYAGTSGFLPAVSADASPPAKTENDVLAADPLPTNSVAEAPAPSSELAARTKRKAEDEAGDATETKKFKSDDSEISTAAVVSAVPNSASPKHTSLPSAPPGSINIFVKEDFREHFCRCAECFPQLSKHPQLLEVEDTYEPPVSESDDEQQRPGSTTGRSISSRSLLDRGEAALSNMDRVRALEGVMAYNHLRDKVKAFLQPFAESGQAVGAEDIKTYFAKLRGDEQAMREAAMGANAGGEVQGDGRREQGGY